MDSTLVTLVQTNPTIADFDGNANAVCAAIKNNANTGVFVFPELSLCGYMPYDYVYNKQFMKHHARAVQKVQSALNTTTHVIVGGMRFGPAEGYQHTRRYNSALILSSNTVRYHDKRALPANDVFVEKRFFTAGEHHTTHDIGSLCARIAICYDLWDEELPFVQHLREMRNTDIIIWLSASPYTKTKHERRITLATRAVQMTGLPLCMANLVGGNDEIVFDGRSFVMNARGKIVHQCALCAEDSYTFEVPHHATQTSSSLPTTHTQHSTDRLPVPAYNKPQYLSALDEQKCEEILTILTTGLTDYMRKTGMRMRVHLGLSGGIDSAITAAIAVRALGSGAVTGVLLPSRYTGGQSTQDAFAVAKNLGIQTITLNIESMFTAAQQTFVQHSKLQTHGESGDITAENIQARIRGLLLMAYSNKHESMLLTTGNKSEVAVGYCTLYGDMCGSLNLIGDLYKTEVYSLSHALNTLSQQEIIPQSVLNKAPTAELRENQKDSDSLPEYLLLDQLLYRFVELHQSPEDCETDKALTNLAGYTSTIAHEAWGLLTHAEYKRNQAAPIIKISETAFGRGRIMPIASKI